jgi:hypothetical protein
MKLSGMQVYPDFTRAKVLSREAERRLDATYEDTGSLTRDGFSDRLAKPVKAGKLN